MTVILKNTQDRILNLGCKNGCHVCLGPQTQKEFESNIIDMFEFEITRAVEAGFLEVVTAKKQPRIADSIEEKAPISQKPKAKRAKIIKE